MVSFLKRQLISIQFLTKIPIPLKGPYSNKDLGRSLLHAPVTGLLIGVILYGVYVGGSFFLPVLPLSVILLFLYAFLTGGLHLDGVGDVCDGLFSYRKGDEMLAIMKDSRLGTFGFLGLFFLLLLDMVTLNEILKIGSGLFLIVFPAIGRVGILLAAAFNSYLKGKTGMAKQYVDYTRMQDLIIPFLLIGGIVYFLLDWVGIIAYVTSLIIGLLLSKWCNYRLDGINGDVLGFVCEWTQAVFLLIYLGGVLFGR